MLYDYSDPGITSTPITAANFLSYVNDGAYDQTIFHRSINNFVIQGGGFTQPQVPADQPGSDPVAIPSRGTIINEPGNSNLRGTLAMAKVAGQPDSATSQWFINLSDNTFLDTDNGGFTVFGEVLSSDMVIVDTIATFVTYDASTYYSNGALTNLPLQNINTDNIILPDDFAAIISMTMVVPESAQGSLFIAGLALMIALLRRSARAPRAIASIAASPSDQS